MDVDNDVRRLGLTVQDFEKAMGQLQLLQQQLAERDEKLSALEARSSSHSSGDCEGRLQQTVKRGETERLRAEEATEAVANLKDEIRSCRAKEAGNWKRMVSMQDELKTLEEQAERLQAVNRRLESALKGVDKTVASRVTEITKNCEAEERRKTMELKDLVAQLAKAQKKLLAKIESEKKAKHELGAKLAQAARELEKQHDLETKMHHLERDLEDCVSMSRHTSAASSRAPSNISFLNDREEEEESLGTDSIGELFDLQNAHADAVSKLKDSERAKALKAADLEARIEELKTKDAELAQAAETRNKLVHAAAKMLDMRVELASLKKKPWWRRYLSSAS